jgi:hydroxymethylglutaryl-CoA lyase
MIQIFEVGVRDGLQNESRIFTFEDKIFLAQGLIDSGIKDLELGAFVRPDKVPQMADTEALYQAVREKKLKQKNTNLWALVPNLKGLERAIASKVSHIAVFTAATQSFAKKNIGMSIEESLATFKEVIQEAKRNKIKVRGYVSTAFFCPFEGQTPSKKTIQVVSQLMDLGVTQVSIGDTIGRATPKDVDLVFKPLLKKFSAKKLAGHFHDTRGTALANALRAIELGIKTLDASAGGLGGCPFAPGATGNLATEDLVYLLNGLGEKTGVDLNKLAQTSLTFSQKIQRPLSSRYLAAFQANGS